MVGRRGLLEAMDVWLHLLRIPSRRVCDRIDKKMEASS
jgi:hypothetical protein